MSFPADAALAPSLLESPERERRGFEEAWEGEREGGDNEGCGRKEGKKEGRKEGYGMKAGRKAGRQEGFGWATLFTLPKGDDLSCSRSFKEASLFMMT